MIGDGGLFPEQWDTSRDLLVVVGRGAEPLIEQLVAQGQQRLFVYLPEEAPTAALPSSAKVTTSPMELFEGILAMTGPLPKRTIVRRQTDPWVSEELHSEVARTVDESLRSKRLQMGTVDKQGTAWLLQGIAALPDVASRPSIAALRGAFVKRPCIIISPGPSLEKNIEHLASAKGRAVLMTCTHALSVLQAHDVVPDVVFAADPSPALLRHYEGVDVSGIEALMVGATCVREHWKQRARRFFSFASNDRIDDWIFEGVAENARLATGGSVACSELSLALEMGCDPVIFVGQDLSFPDGHYYSPSNIDGASRVKPGADGTTFYLVKPGGTEAPGEADADGDLRTTRPQQLQKVAGYHGGLVLTSQSFHSFLIWFETVARSLEGKTMLINATEGGANIRGMQHKPLADVISAYLRDDISVGAVLDRATADFDPGPRRARMRAWIEERVERIRPCLEQASRCRSLARKASRDASGLEDLQKAEADLSRALKPVRFLSLIAQGEIVAAQQRAQEATSLEENLAAAEALFQVVERACRIVHAPLEAALAELA